MHVRAETEQGQVFQQKGRINPLRPAETKVVHPLFSQKGRCGSIVIVMSNGGDVVLVAGPEVKAVSVYVARARLHVIILLS